MSSIMGEEQSGERRTSQPEVGEVGAQSSPAQHQESSITAPQGTETPGELPQRQIGNKKVDDMSFMISCTNWY